MKRPTALPPAALLVGLSLVSQSFAQEAPDPAPAGTIEPEAQPPPAAEAKVKPYLGLGASPVPGFLGKHLNLPTNSGVMVRSLDPDGPAATAGFTVDDVITKIGGKAVASHRELVDGFAANPPGAEVEIAFIHEGKPGTRSVKLGARPLDQPAAAAAGPEIKVLEGQLNLGGGLLGDLQPEAEKQLRKAMENALKNADANRMGIQIIPGGQGGIRLLPGGNGQQNRAQFGVASSVRMMDQDGGSIEQKYVDGGSEVRVTDKDGKEVWSGPWDTEQDKAAAPPNIRKRLETFNLLNVQGRNLPAPVPVPNQDEDDAAEPKADT